MNFGNACVEKPIKKTYQWTLAGRMLLGDQEEEQQPTTAMEYHLPLNWSNLCQPHLLRQVHHRPACHRLRLHHLPILHPHLHLLLCPPIRFDLVVKHPQALHTQRPPPPLRFSLASQTLGDGYSIGKRLRLKHIVRLALAKGAKPNSVSIVLTAADVVVDGFCSILCGTHGSSRWGLPKGNKLAYI